MDFPKLLNELVKGSFSSGAVLGGFKRAGVWPLDTNAMKEKVAHRSVLDQKVVTDS